MQVIDEKWLKQQDHFQTGSSIYNISIKARHGKRVNVN